MPRVADEAYFNHRPGHSEDWRARTACGSIATKEYWYALGKDSRAVRAVGKRICNEICPVREDCLVYALTARIDHGIWGGLDEKERARLSVSQRVFIVNKRTVTRYADPEEIDRQEQVMVTVIAKVKFVPNLAVGETGEVEDAVAKAAVRNGYAELVGNPENYDDWLYHKQPLRLAGKPAKPAKATESKPATTKARATKAQTKQVAATATDGGE